MGERRLTIADRQNGDFRASIDGLAIDDLLMIDD
jgi:hypothetical protein